ncbi:(Fe-S)-binding protein [Thermoflexus sp.]|uniref:(Fe-S)-binding protein n=1 Tax=Thermoflexus sp. TaxID=1969742 RepID=UPI002ADE87F9|nr:(Fe-S)-binding protein [Thermoflexus sp.]
MSRMVQLFVTCLVDWLRPEIGIATVQLLERIGVTVRFPEAQTCCGQPAFNVGRWQEARAMAEHWVRTFDPDLPVVVPSGSCAAMIRHGYRALLEGRPLYARWEALAAQTCELSQYLIDVLGIQDLGVRREGRVTYHPSCHLLRMLGVREAPERLIRATGAAYHPLPDAEACCGFGGLFSVHFEAVSGAMLARKIQAIRSTGAEVVLGCDWSCLMHIGGGLHRQGLPVRALHLAEWLAEGLL